MLPLRVFKTLLISSARSGWRHQQQRWATVHDIRFLNLRPNSNQVIEKYKTKLDRKAREEGHSSIGSLRTAYEEKIHHVRTTAVETTASQPRTSGTTKESLQSPSEVPGSPRSASADSPSPVPGIKPLSAYLNLSKISVLPNEEIEHLWRLRHASDPLSLCAVIPISTYTRIYHNAQKHPRFILPLPRPASPEQQVPQPLEPPTPQTSRTAADIHFLQWGFLPPSVPPAPGSNTHNTHTSTVLFTHLASFKSHGAYAQPHTTVTHHLDLADSHGLVLLNGSVVKDRGVSVDEGRWLLMCLQRFYDFERPGEDQRKQQKRKGLLEGFSSGDVRFKVEELMDEAETMG